MSKILELSLTKIVNGIKKKDFSSEEVTKSFTAIGTPGNKPLWSFFLSKFFENFKASSKHSVI